MVFITWKDISVDREETGERIHSRSEKEMVPWLLESGQLGSPPGRELD